MEEVNCFKVVGCTSARRSRAAFRSALPFVPLCFSPQLPPTSSAHHGDQRNQWRSRSGQHLRTAHAHGVLPAHRERHGPYARDELHRLGVQGHCQVACQARARVAA
eukprot:scaffold1307_cov200-Pinguiococcus_pyrenoidosus.AAC.5